MQAFSAPTTPTVHRLVDQQDNKELSSKKAKHKSAADVFNADIAKGLQFIVSEQLIPENSPTEIARFLHKNKFLNKHKIGDLLGER